MDVTTSTATQAAGVTRSNIALSVTNKAADAKQKLESVAQEELLEKPAASVSSGGIRGSNLNIIA